MVVRKELLVKLAGKKQMHSGIMNRHPGKSTGTQFGCVRTGSGRPRQIWS